jgi:hypothetical protein
MVLNTTYQLVFQSVSQTPEMGKGLEYLGAWGRTPRVDIDHHAGIIGLLFRVEKGKP